MQKILESNVQNSPLNINSNKRLIVPPTLATIVLTNSSNLWNRIAHPSENNKTKYSMSICTPQWPTLNNSIFNSYRQSDFKVVMEMTSSLVLAIGIGETMFLVGFWPCPSTTFEMIATPTVLRGFLRVCTLIHICLWHIWCPSHLLAR